MKSQPSEFLDRLPPQDLDAERWVIGSVLLRPACLDAVTLRPQEFHADAHRRLWAQFLAMRERGESAEPTLVVLRLREAGELEAAGGRAYLTEILSSIPHAAHAAHYAAIVREKARLRAVVSAATEMLREAYGREGTATELAAACEAKLHAVSDEQFDGEPKPITLGTIAALDRAQAILDRRQAAGLLTGIWEFDERTGGLFPGELSILAARPRIGKTALACQIAMHAAQSSRLVYFVSLEMSDWELTTRILCSESGVNSKRIRTGRLDQTDMVLLAAEANRIGNANMVIHDRPAMTVMEIARSARRLAAKGLALVVVDYLQRLTPADRRLERREQVGDAVKALKTLARELKVPVLCLAQLNRESERDGCPHLYHLGESAAIEQEADVVNLLWRPAPWTEEQRKNAKRGIAPPADQAALIIEKNRNGETAILRMSWEAARTRFMPPADWFAPADQAAADPQQEMVF